MSLRNREPRTFVSRASWLVASTFLITCSLVAQETRSGEPVPTAPREYVPKIERLEFDMAKVASPAALSADALKGRGLFVKYCDFCHDGRPRTGGTVAPRLNDELVMKRGEAAVAAKIMTQSPGSTMPGYRYSLSTTDVDQLIAYLKSVRRDAKGL